MEAISHGKRKIYRLAGSRGVDPVMTHRPAVMSVQAPQVLLSGKSIPE